MRNPYTKDDAIIIRAPKRPNLRLLLLLSLVIGCFDSFRYLDLVWGGLGLGGATAPVCHSHILRSIRNTS